MRRLLTGYAVVFNRRHHRSGHLFQSRYKSIVGEEDAYLLELVRYIHLNPLHNGAEKYIRGTRCTERSPSSMSRACDYYDDPDHDVFCFMNAYVASDFSMDLIWRIKYFGIIYQTEVYFSL